MRKISSLLCAIVAMLMTACQSDKTFDNTISDGATVISVSLEQTRTSLGAKGDDGIYPLYWSEGDRIAINGIRSEEAEIDTKNRSVANFQVATPFSYPCAVTYPYSSATTAEEPIVEFPAEQLYEEENIADGYVPMCGYATEANKSITLSHLAAILRFPVKATFEGVVLEKIVITSTTGAKLAGEFAVDCTTATLSPTESTVSSVTYLLPANYTLSTSEASIFYISLPAVNVGNCTIEFVESSGKKMVANWSPSKPLAKGVMREFKEIGYARQVGTALELMPVEEDSFTIYYKRVYGNVRYSDGSPIAGVAVSDGFQVTSTDQNGYYELEGVTPNTWYIYCSLPADVEVPIDEYGRPCFFQKYPQNTARHDFTFEKMAGGKESEFALLALADTQVSTTNNVNRFKAQASPEIKNYSQACGRACYGVALGDIIYSPASTNNEYLLYEMREAFDYDITGVPIFAVFGNHDNAHFSTSKPIFTDPRNKNTNLAIQRPFEDCFGPVDYSFNRSDAHIICIRNTQWENNTHPDGDHISLAFTDEQYAWLQQDLALVPKDKVVIMCVHIPLFNRTGKHVQDVLNLLDEYDEAHILSGHLHFRQCYDHTALNTGHKVFEQSWSSAHGVGWGKDSNINCDGAPSGYGVIVVRGNSVVQSIHKGYPYGMNDANYQIRLHRGGDITGAEISGSNSNGTKGYYQLPYDSSVVLANVFSSDPWGWTIEVWGYDEESDTRTSKIGEMTSLAGYNNAPLIENLIGSYTLDDPRRPAEGVESGRDFWVTGVYCGYAGYSTSNIFHRCHTMWKFTLPDPDARVMVVAKDRWGNEYTQTEFQVGTDIGYAFYDPQYNPQ